MTQPSSPLSKEEILRKHYEDFDVESNWMFDGSVRGVFDAMEEYANNEIWKFFDWFSQEDSPYSILYGNDEIRIATNERDLSINEVIDAYLKHKSLKG